MALATGTRLGPYEITAPLGAGAMGEVYRARDTRLDRIVAIKVLPAHLASDPKRRERFEREAKAISSLNHPHICILHDVGREAGVDFLVMEYLEGETLAKRLERGPVPLDQLLRVAIEVADGLDQAHRHGVIHRDLKPGNIMLVPRSGAKLMDFGLAKPVAPLTHLAIQDGGGAAGALPTVSGPLTAEGAIVGTLNYMAPEQFEGKEADARTDLFAFGAVLYEMATGKKAFQGKKPASTMVAILEHDPLPMTQLQPMTPPTLERLVKACLAKEPDERWQTAHDVLMELKWIAEGGLPAPVISRRKKRELLAWGVVGLLAIALAAVLVSQLRNVPPQASPVRFSVYPPEKVAFVGYDHLALSPDGRRLAFTARSSEGKTMLWLRPLDSFIAQAVPGTEGAVFPFWSPDSKSIAFFSGGKLRKIELGSGNVETLCDAGTGGGGTWNRGGVIVFAPQFAGGLMRVSAAGGAATPVTQLDPAHGETIHLWPVFLPDGRHFLFDLFGQDNSGIYVASLDSSERRRLVPHQNIYEITPVAYAPPGHLLFVRHAVLMAQPFDARRLELRGEPVRLADVSSISGPSRVPFSVSANGVLAYRQQTGSDVVQPTWFSREGKQLGAAGPPGPYFVPPSPALSSGFAISPDGRTLAVTRLEVGAPFSVWTIDLVRGTAAPFAASDYWSAWPVWSPDGSRIVFSSVHDTPPNLYVKSLSGAGGEERVERSINVSYASDWSPDSRYILYNVIDPKTKADLWLLPLSGDRKPVPFLQTQFNESNGRISPDGKWAAFQSDKSGRFEIYVTSFPTAGREWEVSTNGGTHPEWRGDGKELIYLAPERKLMSVEVKTGNGFDAGVPKLLFQLPSDTYAAARDGKRFLVAVETQKAMPSPIQVVLDWTAGLHP